ncbi:MAG: hypothetical protein AAF555_05765 [Verrucomicrobiota bacterium]
MKSETKTNNGGGSGSSPSACLPILALPSDTDEKTVAECRAAGYLPVLTDSPDSVRVILPGSQVQSSDLLMAALAGLCCHPQADGKRTMVEELHRRLKARESSANDQRVAPAESGQPEAKKGIEDG